MSGEVDVEIYEPNSVDTLDTKLLAVDAVSDMLHAPMSRLIWNVRGISKSIATTKDNAVNFLR